MRVRAFIFAVLVLAFCGVVSAQDNQMLPDKPAHNPALPTITFQFEFTGADPSHYAMSVDSTGNAAYTSTSPQDDNAGFLKPGEKPTGEPYVTKFQVSQATTAQIFDLAKKLNDFNGKFDYTKTRVANTGAKTLIYADPARHFETTFNWSQNTDAMELAHLFQNISATLEFDQRLRHEMRYQKLALDETLKQLEEAVQHNNAAELQIIAPTLQRIANDSSFMHIARREAQKLLQAIPQ